jgi:hypothetical protein
MAIEAVGTSRPRMPVNIRLKCTTPRITDRTARSRNRGGGQRSQGSSMTPTTANRSATKAMGGTMWRPVFTTAKLKPQTTVTASSTPIMVSVMCGRAAAATGRVASASSVN